MKEYIEREAACELLAMALDDWKFKYSADRLNEIPAADVKPVVRGEWVTGDVLNEQGIVPPIETEYWRPNGGEKRFYGSMMYCSACLAAAYYDAEIGTQEFAFCPYCGADMQGEVKHG